MWHRYELYLRVILGACSGQACQLHAGPDNTGGWSGGVSSRATVRGAGTSLSQAGCIGPERNGRSLHD